MNEPELLPRLERLESHLAHLERQNDALNEVVIAQGKELHRLRTAVERLVRDSEAQEVERTRHSTPPPHYGR